MSKILQIVINQLCGFFPEFDLYFNTHFEFTKKVSLTPNISPEGLPQFEETIKIRRKILTEDNKHFYYKQDLSLWEDLNE